MKLKFPPGCNDFVDSLGAHYKPDPTGHVEVDLRRHDTIHQMRRAGFTQVIEVVVPEKQAVASTKKQEEKPRPVPTGSTSAAVGSKTTTATGKQRHGTTEE